MEKILSSEDASFFAGSENAIAIWQLLGITEIEYIAKYCQQPIDASVNVVDERVVTDEVETEN